MKELTPLIKGFIKIILRYSSRQNHNPGGGLRSRYYYSVFCRHYLHAIENGLKPNPRSILELGPGSTLGVGITALILGAEKYYAIDVIKHWNPSINIELLNEIVDLIRKREPIPNDVEFPNLKPIISKETITPRFINPIIDEHRLNRILRSIKELDNSGISELIMFMDNSKKNEIPDNSIDFILSQAVLEHIEHLELTYENMYRWTKPGAIISHVVDFKSHGITKAWNGHWQYDDMEWRIIKANKSFLINRHPLSYHQKLLEINGFELLNIIKYKRKSDLKRRDLAKKYENLSDDDLTTSGAYYLARKK